jgi:hypothetical protein
VRGSGRAFKQSPPPGSTVKGQTPVSVWFH